MYSDGEVRGVLTQHLFVVLMSESIRNLMTHQPVTLTVDDTVAAPRTP